MRTCWHFSFRSYDPRNCPDKTTLFRRIAMIYVLFVRTGMSVLAVVSAILAMNIAAIVIYVVLAIIGFWFIAWCLAVIGDAQGERRVLGRLIVSYRTYVVRPPIANLKCFRVGSILIGSCTPLLSFTRLALCSGGLLWVG